MSFKVSSASFLLFWAGILCANPSENILSVGGIAVARPLVLRSDFAAKDVVRRFMCRAQWRTPESTARFVGRHTGLCSGFFHEDYIAACGEFVKGGMLAPPVPQLKNGTFCEVGLGFDMHGGSKFEKVILSKKLHLWETQYIGSRKECRMAMNKYLAELVASDPEKFKGSFSEETIQQYVNWVKSGNVSSSNLNNPTLANGEKCVFHHDVASKQILVITENEHVGTPTLPSKGHGSGTNFAGGGEIVYGQRQTLRHYLKASAMRWGGLAGIDLLSSTVTMSATGVTDKSQYIANAGSVAAAYLTATMSESLFCTAYPLAAGTTPAWIGLIPICSGGVATWVASGVYMLTRYAVMYGWNQHQIEQARRIEHACKKAEQKARIGLLYGLVNNNSTELNTIVRSVRP